MSDLMNSPAGKRILSLLDDNSFVEIGEQVHARSTDFFESREAVLRDGVVTGYGTIGDRMVYVYSQDPKSLGGSLGEMHARKILNLYRLARKTGSPIIGMLDSTGIRLEESMDALQGLGMVYKAMAKASGIIPQITAVFGSAGGGLSILTELSDFVFMEDNAKLFLNSPNSIKGNCEEKNDTSSAGYRHGKSGTVDWAGPEEELYSEIRSLMSFLPDNCTDEAFLSDPNDDLNRTIDDMAACGRDAAQAIVRMADFGEFFETRRGAGLSMVTGFIRLNGSTVGVIANRREKWGEDGKAEETFDNKLCVKGIKKAVKLVNFCDAFSIPILTLTDVKGYCSGKCAEKYMSTQAAKLLYAFSTASVAKVNVIMGECYGSAGIIMNSKAIGADYVYAWSNAKIGAIDGKHAAEILYDGKDAAFLKEKAAAYDELQGNVASAAGRGYVDTIIDPEDTRRYVIGAFEMLYGKDNFGSKKKHGTV